MQQQRFSMEAKTMALRGGAPVDEISPEGAMNIVFISAEIAPWSITGGLGAVCDGLPRAMAKAGHRVMSIAPRYDQYFDAWDTEFEAEVNLGEATTKVRFFHCFKKGVDRVFVDHPLFLEKVWGLSKQKLYGPKWGQDYADNQLRFSMFCQAALVATKQLSLGGTPYGEDVVFVANDWHASLVPMYIKEAKAKGEWAGAKTVALLHNMVFQGRFPADTDAAKRLHLTQESIDSMQVMQTLKVGKQKAQTKGLKSKEEVPNPPMQCLNFLLGAIKSSDLVLTVSPKYAVEVAKDPIKGAEMEKALTQVGIKGILNGVEDIVRPDNAELGLGENAYDTTSLEKKKAIKMLMQKSLKLEVDPDIPLFVFLGRLDAQKGVDIMFEAIAKALDSGVKAQFITMGSGIEQLEEVAADLDDRYPGQFKAVLSFKGQEKYRTYAAADFAMMPSRYEPCGLVQMEGMRFGTLPIVAPTGGLFDTVKDMKTGLVMDREMDQDGLEPEDVTLMVESFQRAIKLYQTPDKLQEMQVAAMESATEFSWQNSVKQYIAEFKKIGVKTM